MGSRALLELPAGVQLKLNVVHGIGGISRDAIQSCVPFAHVHQAHHDI